MPNPKLLSSTIHKFPPCKRKINLSNFKLNEWFSQLISTKLNQDLVCKIRNEKKENLTSNYNLSKKYNVSEATIANLINKKSWIWV
jgi:hypothetical protein